MTVGAGCAGLPWPLAFASGTHDYILIDVVYSDPGQAGEPGGPTYGFGWSGLLHLQASSAIHLKLEADSFSSWIEMGRSSSRSRRHY